MTGHYKICFLGYKKLADMAREVISGLDYPDTTVVEKECTAENISQIVNEAHSEGCQVFIAGSANAAEFKRRFYYPFIELHIDFADYLLALKRAKKHNATQVAITVYRHSAAPDMALLEEIMGLPLQLVYYENVADITSALKYTGCDFVVGAALANDVAAQMGINSTLIYKGEYSIRSSIEQARNLAAELRALSRIESINSAIIKNVPAGIVMTDENGEITAFNDLAKNLTGLGGMKLRGRRLEDVLPSLSYEAFCKTGQLTTDQKRLFNGAMIRCVQTRLFSSGEPMGMLTTLQADNTRRKKVERGAEFTARHQWKDFIGHSTPAKNAMAEAKVLAELKAHIMIQGQIGTGKSFFAQCIHNGSSCSNEPYIVINASAIAPQDAARLLFGSEDAVGLRPGFLETAGSGTIVLQGLGGASELFNACLHHVLSERYFCRVGGITAVPFRARLITLVSPEDRSRIPRELWDRLSVFLLNLPTLQERQEDIIPLFRFLLMQENDFPSHRIQKEMSDILQFYSWPLNIVSLSAVSKRFAFACRKAVNPSVNARQLLLIEAIGEETLLQDIYARYPALLDVSNSAPEAVMEGVAVIRHLLKYNNSIIAEKLGLGRTTLWRIQKSLEAKE